MFNWLAHLVYKRPAWILIFWAVVLLAAAPLANLAPKRFSGSTSSVKNSEAERVNRLIETEFGQQRVDTTLIVTEGNRAFKDAEFLERYDALVQKLEAVEGVKSVTRFDAESPLKLFGESNGKRITATVLETAPQPNPNRCLEEIRVLTRAARLPDTQLYVTGATAITKDFIERSESDTKRSEFAALPLTDWVLVLAFGALVAAGIPLIVGMLSITLSLALIYLVTYVLSVTSFAQSVVTMLGLGAGIDYALLLVNRF
ncbi:MAG: MMPL family transporter, partial [Pleurocapsa sp. SU_196_0]|nr:MMPL family transporter [Pleurocapsa sp. SU_196_0]